jgi:nucleotide-binding universal stress UspA family protein
MYERILAAVDQSQMAERVLAAAKELATLCNGEVYILHVWEAEPAQSRSGKAPSYQDACIMVEMAEQDLARAGIRAKGEVAPNLYSNAAREITWRAQAHNVDAIVIGSRRRSDLTALIAGSTAHKVLHMADRPVVVVP